MTVAYHVSLLECGLRRRREAEVVQGLVIQPGAAGGQVGASQRWREQQSEKKRGKQHGAQMVAALYGFAGLFIHRSQGHRKCNTVVLLLLLMMMTLLPLPPPPLDLISISIHPSASARVSF
jgi:hypothetical protein